MSENVDNEWQTSGYYDPRSEIDKLKKQIQSQNNAPKWGKATMTPTMSSDATYVDRIKNSQVKPEDIKKNWEDYKGAQTGLADKYASGMEKYIGQNLEANKTLAEKYAQRTDPQFAKMEQAQSNLEAAGQRASSAYDAERAAAESYFKNETTGRYQNALSKTEADYESLKKQIQGKMDDANAYYQGNIRPQFAKLMEGGLSLRDASDPNNYVSKGVQGAYEGLIDKSAKDASQLQNQIKKSGQADYGVLSALAGQASQSIGGMPTTGAQTQLTQSANQAQASQAYQAAMRRVADIQDQQRLYAQSARQTGLQSGMDQSWKNYGEYRTSTQAAQQADLANYEAQLAGLNQQGGLTTAQGNLRTSVASGLANARSALSGDIRAGIGGAYDASAGAAQGVGNLASQINSAAGNQLSTLSNYQDDVLRKQNLVPEFQYGFQSGMNQGDFTNRMNVLDLGSRNATTIANTEYAQRKEREMLDRQDKIRADDIALQREAIAQQVEAARALREAENDASMWGSLFSLGGTVAGGLAGSLIAPGAGTMAGASIGGGLASMLGNVGTGGRYNGGSMQPYLSTAAQFYGQQKPQVGVSPVMQALLQNNPNYNKYGLGIDPNLYQAPIY